MTLLPTHLGFGRSLALMLGLCAGLMACPQMLTDDFTVTADSGTLGAGGFENAAGSGTGGQSRGGSASGGTTSFGGSQVGGNSFGGSSSTNGGQPSSFDAGQTSRLLPDGGTPFAQDAGPTLGGDASTLSCELPTPQLCEEGCQECCADNHCDDSDPCTEDSCDGSGACQASVRCESGGLCCEGIGCSECCSDLDCGGSPLVCVNGSCETECLAPLKACGLVCKDLATDTDNCGECGRACGLGRFCVSGSCTPSWQTIASSPSSLTARQFAGYGAMDGKVFIIGGRNNFGTALSNGAIYDPSLDSWEMLPSGGPTGRVLPTAVWTGSEMIVWGGGNAGGSTDFSDGAMYNPSTGQWSSMTNSGVPSPRRAPHAFWTGSHMLVWGGVSGGELVERNIVYLYDPVADEWTTGSGNGVPPFDNVLDPVVAWSGIALYVYGGANDGFELDTAFEYNPVTDLWVHRPDGPSDRAGAFGEWDGSGLVVWGGSNDNALLFDGKRWEPNPLNPSNGGTWSNIASNATRARMTSADEVGWTAAIGNSRLLLLGGEDGDGGLFSDTMIYDSSANTWTNEGSWPSGSAHLGGVGVWTGQEFVLWGGRSESGQSPDSTGERYRP